MITMENNDDTSDSEEILVYVEFEVLDDNVFNEKQLQLDMIGIDTEHPIMQINGKFYEGTYEDVVGTYMFFTKTNDSAISDPVFDIAPNFKYFAKTKKFLKMQRIFIKSRTEVLGDSENNQCIPNSYTLKQAGIPLQYRTEGIKSLIYSIIEYIVIPIIRKTTYQTTKKISRHNIRI
ncbi:general transcription factor 3C polypeptide 6 isoform X3 [Apis laboriosa]|uniref:general transcription factor 3C polypeptide 6 isoform X3 n=1 Tax=Apis laboriosa TaxID=183418 RepID=UPI001CC76515|nr:general transcription factor 3C polypeptide 6 isoform X3 [Apis laboriosa]